MLFLKDLLKFKSTFGKLWLAGTVGVKKRPFSKDLIESSNIDEFILAITNVELPLSPRLSGTFLRGICAIYEQKFHLLQLRVQTLFRRLYIETEEKTIVRAQAPEKNKRRIKGTKRPKNSETLLLTIALKSNPVLPEASLSEMKQRDQPATLTQMLVDEAYCLMNKTPANCNDTINEMNSPESLNHQFKPNNETSDFFNFELENEISSCKDTYNETLHGGQFMNEDILLENLIHHGDQINHQLDLLTPRPVIPCADNDKTPMNSTCRASRLSIHNSAISWKSDFVNTPSCNVVGAITMVKDNQNFLKKRPMMVKHQQGVSRSKRNTFDKQIVLDKTTLETWNAEYVSLLRSTDIVCDRNYFNQSVWGSIVSKNPRCRVNKCIESYWEKYEGTKFIVHKDLERTASKLKESNHNVTEIFRFSEIEKLRGIGDDSTTTNPLGNVDPSATCGSAWRMASLEFTGWKHRGVAVDKRFSLASGYASDSQAETGGFSSVDTPHLDNNLQNDNLFSRGLGLSFSMENGFPNVSLNDWRLRNQMFDTGTKCLAESTGHDKSCMSEEGYGLSHTFFKSTSPTFMDRTFLPISVETIQNESQDGHGSKMHGTIHDLYTWTTRKFYDSLLYRLMQNSTNKEIIFTQLVSPDEADTLQASTTFFNLLMLASSNQVSITQASFDSPLLITLALDVVNAERCTKNDTTDVSFYSQNALILTPC